MLFPTERKFQGTLCNSDNSTFFFLSFLNRMDICCILFCYYSTLLTTSSLPPCNERCFPKTTLQTVNKVHWWESQASTDLNFLSFGETSFLLEKMEFFCSLKDGSGYVWIVPEHFCSAALTQAQVLSRHSTQGQAGFGSIFPDLL